ncbi:PhoB family transcriptional regulator [Kurthia sp. 3B1D]|uniref:PhoB family transcriptional regulator n=1 Tax=Candidatus Kurthia intestinigallinarum TaxID=1562256 RepID=A0A433RQ32_9BACL|nr:response regulator transcription factor [Kurthia sp. 3B1D]RUS52531.1 PhoB family transcriptional regulator [Kurthia sp. 3B1D]HIX42816.1 response regulator transcription factor [Candidatus Kurthia intestinigallinarum]
MDMYTILVVDDDADIRSGIEIYLRNEGYAVVQAENGEEALALLATTEVHLIILDVMMPKLDGIQATFKIRAERNIPIIMLSAKVEEADQILGLSVGADDYMTKPFRPLELLARVKSQLRRYMTLGTYAVENNAATIDVGDLSINVETKQCFVSGNEVKLTPLEFQILTLLMQHPGRVYPIDAIYEAVWQEPAYNAANIVAVHIRKIREKVEANPKNPQYVKVVWGVGYKIEQP